MADAQLTCSRADDFVLVCRPKKGTAFVEARLNDGYTYTDKGWQQILAHLERELSPDKLNEDAVISLETDLTDTSLSKYVPQGIFQSLRVVDIQGLDPATRQISARDVAIKFNPYKLSSELPTTYDHEQVVVLPNSKLDGLWEFSVKDNHLRSELSRWVKNFAKAIQSRSTIHIVLIDSIESYSWTRRATVSPETDTKFHEITCSSGFDTLAAIPNVVVICTSRTGNLPVHSLPDPSGKPVRLAYLAPLTLPRLDLAQRYDVLCSQFQAYMDAGVITCNDKLDDCLGAIRDREDGKATPSIQILELAEHVGDDISARLGGQIVILALMTDLKEERCDMATAVSIVWRYHTRLGAERTTTAN
ncbi:hypothetical protein GCG54_00010445 [Colletotrichum gloeosporioides]|uniref:Uncharacterized protein n=1 Tax=Colletotrichum gloeosporioides TaxID=474922 RepID=A0A8H4CW90_COLGL|nr:uncharacterized protein GCG54_00010445 [Colletotrichum gloeosporioides]KAF3811109.1 hypothetical protein GCG54_00010445 [Colletotrichum gloeosporioides]